ncbi:DUF2924 domain-containing protein [Erythrobacter crassostreae]|uniref:DUF2924 domain-containing protein n=1 Tax=Erythrobacter crassostreae TaxID=2828328 RepID=A0A9X1JP23_9SPHN|nr:DUF2924 domain-containing protein [Erythrobacter crassostrea]MBV7258982.1 DUF2924 domain-containing protein [Erythrobacter crassostrea]
MDIEEKIAALKEMSPAELRLAWRNAYGTPAPPALGLALTLRALAAHYQEPEAGKLNRAELRQLGALGSKDLSRKEGRVSTEAKPGTWLSRTWHGEVHEVVVLESGCEYRGHTFGSLSAVASHITGAKWSGPRFFGLNSSRLGELKVAANG